MSSPRAPKKVRMRVMGASSRHMPVLTGGCGDPLLGAACTSCHAGPLLGARSANLPRVPPYSPEANPSISPL